MAAPGLRSIEGLDLGSAPTGDVVAARPLPDDLRLALAQAEPALAHFEALPPSHRKRYQAWIDDAKRAETRARRIVEAVELLREGRRLGMK